MTVTEPTQKNPAWKNQARKNHARKTPARTIIELIALFATLASATATLPAQERGINSQRPVQTELLAPLDAGHLHLGSPVLAKVKYPWNDQGCKLVTGSIVAGYVASLEQHTKQNKGSSVELVFNKADCNGHSSVPLTLVVFAVVAHAPAYGGSAMIDRDGLFGQISARPVQTMGGGMTSTDAAQLGLQTSYAPNSDMSIHGAKTSASDKILPGQVVGIKKVMLAVGTGAEGGSVLSSPDHNLRLENTTELVLMSPASLAPARESTSPSLATNTHSASAALGPAPEPPESATTNPLLPPAPSDPVEPTKTIASTEPTKPTELPAPTDETEVCASSCSTTADSGIAPTTGAFASLSAANLGYFPHDKREFTAFSHEAAITYLDAANLLFTFDPHMLRQRSGKGFRPESARTVRAVLVDPSTQSVKRILDWQVPGEGEYLWRAGSGRVLVHISHQLRLLGADLTPIHMIPVPGELAWVASSPDGSRFAIGILHERHTPALHQLIFEATNVDPEEDIDVQVFDRDFNLLLTTTQPSTMYPPVLADSGEILVHPSGHDRWNISEFRWDATSHPIAAITSSCHPTVSTPLPGRIFVVGCSSSPSLNWYRLLRFDGHTVLKDRGSSQEIEQAARSSTETEVAVRVVRTFRSTPPGNAFHKTDLREQEISVYDASDGHRLFTTSAADIALAEQSFALSPGGHQIAVLHNNSIAFYSLGESGSSIKALDSSR